jgi:hypothetical protein
MLEGGMERKSAVFHLGKGKGKGEEETPLAKGERERLSPKGRRGEEEDTPDPLYEELESSPERRPSGLSLDHVEFAEARTRRRLSIGKKKGRFQTLFTEHATLLMDYIDDLKGVFDKALAIHKYSKILEVIISERTSLKQIRRVIWEKDYRRIKTLVEPYKEMGRVGERYETLFGEKATKKLAEHDPRDYVGLLDAVRQVVDNKLSETTNALEKEKHFVKETPKKDDVEAQLSKWKRVLQGGFDSFQNKMKEFIGLWLGYAENLGREGGLTDTTRITVSLGPALDYELSLVQTIAKLVGLEEVPLNSYVDCIKEYLSSKGSNEARKTCLAQAIALGKLLDNPKQTASSLSLFDQEEPAGQGEARRVPITSRGVLTIYVRVETKARGYKYSVKEGRQVALPGRSYYTIRVGDTGEFEARKTIVLDAKQHVTFSIDAPGHPFYITRHDRGGTHTFEDSVYVPKKGEVITPMQFPDLSFEEWLAVDSGKEVALYYQCNIHKNMGGRLIIQPSTLPAYSRIPKGPDADPDLPIGLGRGKKPVEPFVYLLTNHFTVEIDYLVFPSVLPRGDQFKAWEDAANIRLKELNRQTREWKRYAVDERQFGRFAELMGRHNEFVKEFIANRLRLHLTWKRIDDLANHPSWIGSEKDMARREAEIEKANLMQKVAEEDIEKYRKQTAKRLGIAMASLADKSVGKEDKKEVMVVFLNHTRAVLSYYRTTISNMFLVEHDLYPDEVRNPSSKTTKREFIARHMEGIIAFGKRLQEIRGS